MTEPRVGYTGGHLMLAALGGAAVGAAVAILTAPKAGRETRAAIGDTFRNGKEKARHIPGAVKVAGVAAREAFVDAMREEVPV